MALVSRTLIGRGMARSASQIAISVVATLIASSIYSGLRREVGASHAVAPPSVTVGGKYAARIEGAEMPALPEPAPPVLSIVNWAITAPAPTRPVDDIAWSGAEAGPVAFQTARPDPVPTRPAKHVVKRAVAIPVVTASRVAPPVVPPSAVAAAAPSEAPSVWSVATSTAHSVVAFGGSAVALGTSALARLIP